MLLWITAIDRLCELAKIRLAGVAELDANRQVILTYRCVPLGLSALYGVEW
jgi:hypothetical protein